MKARVRPGMHYAAVPGGVCFAHREKSFVMAGPPALYELLDVSLGALVEGTDPQSLAHAIRAPQAEPVFDRLLAVLLERDVAFDVDALTPEPSAIDADRYEEALRWCEDHCADPYAAFAAVRAASVVVAGAGPAIEPLRRTLESFGVGEVIVVDRLRLDAAVSRHAAQPPAIVIDVDDMHVAGDAEPRIPHGVPCVRVIVGDGGAVVGAPTSQPQHQVWVGALAHRAFERIAADPAAYPLSAVLAGSLAAHSVLHRLASAATAPQMQATIVHGRLLVTSIVPYQQPTSTTQEAAPPPDPASTPSIANALELAQPMFAPFCGLFRRGDDTDVAQLPLSVATVELLGTTPLVRVAGWGRDRESATFDAMLAGMRATVSGRGGIAEICTPGAGLTWSHASLDARLRAITNHVVADPHIESREVDWCDLNSSRTQSLWSLLEDFYRFGLSVDTRNLGSSKWSLATVRAAGAVAIGVAQWAPSTPEAIYHALAAVVAIAQTDDRTAKLLAAPVGTSVLARASAAHALDGLRATEQYAARIGRRWIDEQYPADNVIGPLPLACGWSRLI